MTGSLHIQMFFHQSVQVMIVFSGALAILPPLQMWICHLGRHLPVSSALQHVYYLPSGSSLTPHLTGQGAG